MGDLNELAERFSDENDRASFVEQMHVEESVNQLLHKREKCPYDFDGCHCVDCDQTIPPERLATGAWRDIYCQEMHEKNLKGFNRP